MRRLGIILALMIVLSAMPAVAFGPRTHGPLLQEVCAEPGSWPKKDLCCNQHPDACYAGLVLTDATVFHYITNFKKYQGTHNWGTVERCFEAARGDREDAFCTGMALHAAQDSVSHNLFVPEGTKRYKIFAEAVVHPFLESKIDNRYMEQYPSIDDDLMYYLSDGNLAEFCGGPETIMYKATGMDLGWECEAVAAAVSEGGMYQNVFLVGWLLNNGYKAFIKVSNLLPVYEWIPYADKAKDFSRQVLQDNWPIRDVRGNPYDPTGYEALRLGEIGWHIISWLVIIFLVGYIIFLVTRWRRRR